MQIPLGPHAADNQRMIQLAFNSLKRPEPVTFQPGKWPIQGPIYIPRFISERMQTPFKLSGYGVTFRVQGDEPAFVKPARTNVSQLLPSSYLIMEGFSCDKTLAYVQEDYMPVFRDIRITGGEVGISGEFLLHPHFENVMGRFCKTLIKIRSFNNNASTNAYIVNCRQQSFSEDAIPFDLVCPHSTIVNCTSEGSQCKYHFSLKGTGNTVLDGCYVECKAEAFMRAVIGKGSTLHVRSQRFGKGPYHLADLTTSKGTGCFKVTDYMNEGGTSPSGNLLLPLVKKDSNVKVILESDADHPFHNLQQGTIEGEVL